LSFKSDVISPAEGGEIIKFLLIIFEITVKRKKETIFDVGAWL